MSFHAGHGCICVRLGFRPPLYVSSSSISHCVENQQKPKYTHKPPECAGLGHEDGVWMRAVLIAHANQRMCSGNQENGQDARLRTPIHLFGVVGQSMSKHIPVKYMDIATAFVTKYPLSRLSYSSRSLSIPIPVANNAHPTISLLMHISGVGEQICKSKYVYVAVD